MTQEIQQKSPFPGTAQPFVRRVWPEILTGFLIGAVFGFGSPTFLQLGVRFWGSTVRFDSTHFGDVAVWPKRGAETLFVILAVAAFIYAVRLGVFIKRVWISWRAGLVSGLGVVWFFTSAVTFTLLSVSGYSVSLLLLVVGVAATLLVFRRDAKFSESAKSFGEADTDDPISKKDEDILGRGAVVDGIVRAVVNDCVPVLALTGSYGDGKTSVLNLLSGELELRNDIVCVRFSTWLPVDQKALISSLLNTVLAKLETKLFIPKAKRDLIAISRLLFSVLPKVPVPLMDFVEKPSQEEQIVELRRKLARLPVRVVVLLDDVDRMGRKELDVLFKLLRGVPEFPQFTYVCAFERQSLVQTLRRDDSEKGREEAERFLEKFFPEDIPLPKIDGPSLAVEFEKKFYAICDRNNLIPKPAERQSFKDDLKTLWQLYLKRYFGNLRRVRLFTNRLNRSLPAVGQEVNLRDFVLLEMVRMINPVLYEEIFRNAGYFMFGRWRLTTWLEVAHPDEDEEQKRRNRYFDVLFKDLPRPPEGIVLAVLSEIFPMVSAYLKDRGVPGPVSEGSDEAEQQRRVYHPDFFPRYFIFNVPADLFGENELSTFVAAMNERTDVPQCVALLKGKFAELQDLPMKRWDFLHRINISVARFDQVATQALAVAMAELSDKMEEAGVSEPFEEVTAERIVFGAVNQLQATVGAHNVLEGVIRGASSDAFAARVLNESGSSRYRLLKDVSAVRKDELELAFRERMNAKYGLGGKFSFFPERGRPNLFPVGRWAKCGPKGREQVHAYLAREFRSEYWKIGRFLSYFFPPPEVPPGVDPLTAVQIYFPPKELLELLDAYGDLSASSTDESEAVREFRAMYTDHRP